MLTNADRKLYRSLSVKKYRDDHGLFLVEGRRSVLEALASDFEIRTVIMTPSFLNDEDARPLKAAIRKRRVKTEELSGKEFSGIMDTVHAQGVGAIVEVRKTSVLGIVAKDRPGAVLVALDAVADPGNVGTIIRTCDWFGVDGVLLGEGCVDLYSPKVVRGTMGSIFHLPVAEGVNLEKAIPLSQNSGFRAYVTDASGQSQRGSDPGKALIVFGNEAHGISQGVRALADGTITIPRYGQAESLNVSIACGVVLSDMKRHGHS